MGNIITYEDIYNYINSKENGNGCKLLTTQENFQKTKDIDNERNIKIKLEILCKCGERFYTDFHHFKYRGKDKCNNCSNHKVRTYSDVKLFIEENSNCKLLSEPQDYKNINSNLKLLCNCGDTFVTDFTSFKNKNKRQCNKCGREIQIQKGTKTTNEFKQEIYNLVEDEYEILNEYKNAKEKILIRHNCNKCNNHEWNVLPNNFLSGQRCPKCSSNYQKTTKEFADEVDTVTKGEYSLISEYKNSKTNVKLRHNSSICNNYEYYVSSSNFYHGDRCPKCAGNSQKTTDIFKQEVYDLVKDEYTVLGEYKTAKTKLLIKHNECKHAYSVTPDNFLRNRRCPFCNNSKGEKAIDNLLAKNNIIYSREYTFDDLIGIGGNPLRYDFALFEDKEKTILKLLIEYDGEFHYKKYYDDQNFETQKIHDNLKNEYCKEKNIKLLRIPYWKFDNIEEILNDKLSLV